MTSIAWADDDHRSVTNGQRSLPAEHVGSPTTSQPASPRKSRPTSLDNDLPSRLKRSSLTQPVKPPASRHRHTASTVPAKPSPEPIESQDVSATSTDFLTALAAQERRVLELKEELRLAEEGLGKLKKQWARSEASKRHNESKRIHQMRPMSISGPRTTKVDDEDGSSAWMLEEMQRRKTLMGYGGHHARKGSRRVFSGSRHAKQLSLIPPTREESPSSFTQPIDGLDRSPRTNKFTRSKTEPDLHTDSRPIPSFHQTASENAQIDAGSVVPQKPIDWKEGLWTFFEDLKQATVGDDQARDGPHGSEQGASGGQNSTLRSMWPGLARTNSTAEALRRMTSPPSRPTGINQSGPLIRPRDTSSRNIDLADDAPLVDVGSDFWRENGLDPPKDLGPPSYAISTRSQKQQTPQKPPSHLKDYEEESWETWDSPSSVSKSHHQTTDSSDSSGKTSTSPTASSPATSYEATPRASIGSASHDTPTRDVAAQATVSASGGLRPHQRSKRDSIPWPVLSKAGTSLRRTASHLMEEWERSLSPSHEEEGQQRKEFEMGAERERAEHELLAQMR